MPSTTDSRLRALETARAAEEERNKAMRDQFDSMRRELEDLRTAMKGEFNCLQEGLGEINKVLHNGLASQTRDNTKWREDHQKGHDDAAKETHGFWQSAKLNAFNWLVISGLSSVIGFLAAKLVQ